MVGEFHFLCRTSDELGGLRTRKHIRSSPGQLNPEEGQASCLWLSPVTLATPPAPLSCVLTSLFAWFPEGVQEKHVGNSTEHRGSNCS